MLDDFDFRELRKRRKRMDLTQKELATSSGVSQSMIAKIESGRVEPSFKVAKSIYTALFKHGKRGSRRAIDIMNVKVLFFHPDDDLVKAIAPMLRGGFSQGPVVRDGTPVGTLTESSILEKMSKGGKVLKVREAMEECLPTIPPDTSIEDVIQLLRTFQAVLVISRGEIKGIITKSDLVKEIQILNG